MITKSNILDICPGVAHLDAYYPFLVAGMKRFDITTPKRMGAYIAQILHESDRFRAMEEYASGNEYDTRTDLGNTPEKDGDGAKYKGRGPIQVTGQDMYRSASKGLYDDLRLIEHPELAADPSIGFMVSAWIWAVAKGLNAIADLPEDYVHPGIHRYRKFEYITVKINGGLNGYAERIKYYQRAKKVLSF